MSKEKGVTKSPASKPGTPTTPTQEAEKVKTPEPEAEPPMAPREADDNETINEAPSQWSAIK
ncbi:hypothetical protein CRE_15171 [Caenorhabditis remanei]|nr:hypothetical protein CRE_15171 [Caenorhabditis remanei]